MPNGRMIIGLDIGSFQISAALCELDEVQGVKLRGVGTAPTEGISKGQILDSDALKQAIGMAISRCEQSTGIVAEDVMVNVPLCGIDFNYNSFDGQQKRIEDIVLLKGDVLEIKIGDLASLQEKFLNLSYFFNYVDYESDTIKYIDLRILGRVIVKYA
jgi:cell division ATPase FtsA